eukprot:TRINITY_DN9836_c0_g1_i1.p1 TRINITY_DN9836_c0_g1~~TRINITY_DN9836_c0_g1_i1.p1  ORF type:complete len:300 (+),score=54.01 TRINITY_DN9836_c0_g1_i1:42-941(+)
MAFTLLKPPSTLSNLHHHHHHPNPHNYLFILPRPSQRKLSFLAFPKRSLLFHISSATTTTTHNNPSIQSQQLQQQQESQLSNEPRTRLIAQNVPWTCTCEDIKLLFERHGTVTDVELSMYNSSRNRGLAFVTMGSEEEALAALGNLDSYELEGRVIKVEFAKKLKKKTPVAKESVPKYNVFVGNLTWRVRSRDLRELFGASNGKILSAEVVYHSNPRKSAGYGFVSYGSKEEAESAIPAFTGKRLMGRRIRLGLSKKQIDVGEEIKEGNEFDGLVNDDDDEGLSKQAGDLSGEGSKEAE